MNRHTTCSFGIWGSGVTQKSPKNLLRLILSDTILRNLNKNLQFPVWEVNKNIPIMLFYINDDVDWPIKPLEALLKHFNPFFSILLVLPGKIIQQTAKQFWWNPFKLNFLVFVWSLGVILWIPQISIKIFYRNNILSVFSCNNIYGWICRWKFICRKPEVSLDLYCFIVDFLPTGQWNYMKWDWKVCNKKGYFKINWKKSSYKACKHQIH